MHPRERTPKHSNAFEQMFVTGLVPFEHLL